MIPHENLQQLSLNYIPFIQLKIILIQKCLNLIKLPLN